MFALLIMHALQTRRTAFPRLLCVALIKLMEENVKSKARVLTPFSVIESIEALFHSSAPFVPLNTRTGNR